AGGVGGAPRGWRRGGGREGGWARVGVSGLGLREPVGRRPALSDAGPQAGPFDVGVGPGGAVKSDEELSSVRDSVRINTEGFRIFLDDFAVGRSEAELLAPCEQYFVEQGCGRMTMDMVLVGENGEAEPEFRIASPERPIRE